MTIEELNKLIDLEIQWLFYYATEESKRNLAKESEIYRDLIPMGYTKRPMSLSSRCVPCIITSNETITENFDINKLRKDTNLRGENRYSPVEAFIIIFPEKKLEIFERLKRKEQRSSEF
jgi:hypothetical protein